MKDNIPLISRLLRSLIVEDFAEANNIITSDKFNPNETNMTWQAPVLTAIITIFGKGNVVKKDSENKLYDNKNFRELLKDITKHKDFDPNVVDAEGETILMHIARNSNFNWLVPFILCNKKLDLSIRNFRKRDAIEIAEKTGNTVLADILIAHKARDFRGMPKKRERKKKEAKVINMLSNYNILERIEFAFDDNVKMNPVSLYNLLVNFFKGRYSYCIQIIKDVNFNPNECDKWEEPVLSSLIYYSQDANVKYDEDEFKKIVDAIIELPRFDVNALDADCNTTLMISMGFPKLKWLTEKLFSINHARLDIINDCGENIKEIANKCGNGEFYNSLIEKVFETANIVE